MEKISWSFNYKGKSFKNILKERNTHGDPMFKQNETSLLMNQCEERYFFTLIIYAMQKIKSPKEAKKDLEKKDRIRDLDYRIFPSDIEPYHYFSLPFIHLSSFTKYFIEDKPPISVKKTIQINNELKIILDKKKEIILPYNQLSKTIDKLLLASEKTYSFFRTNKQHYSWFIDYYVSGEFEKEHKEISELDQIPL